MKNLFKLLFISTLLVGFMMSCSSDDDHDFGYGKNHELSAQFKATVAKPSTRVTENNWDKEDAIGIYALKADQALEEAAIYKGNAKYTTVSVGESGDFTPASDDDAIIFEKEGNKLDFIAYYPYVETITDYSLSINTEDQSNLSKIDFLYSNNAKGHNRDNKEVPLQFTHQLAQIVLEITGEADLGDLANLKLAVDGFIPTGTMSLKDGVVALEGTTTKTLNLTATKTDAGAIIRAIVLPGQDMEKTSFVFELGSIKFKAWTPGALSLESGKRVTYTVSLTSDGSVLASPQGTITDWVDVPGEDVVIDPEGGGEEGDITIPDADKVLDFGATADSKVINVTAPATLTWEATTSENWITLETSTATGSGAFTLKVTENPTSTARTGKVIIAPKVTTRADAATTPVEIVVKQEGKGVTPDQNLLFPGSDFEDWAAFTGSLQYTVKYGVQSEASEGREGGYAFYFNETTGNKNDYSFTALLGEDIEKISKISFYLKGTTTSRSLSLNVYWGANYETFNLGSYTQEKVITPTPDRQGTTPNGLNDYVGDINTSGKWIKVTLDVSSFADKINKTKGETIIAFKVGKNATYDLLVDDITFE